MTPMPIKTRCKNTTHLFESGVATLPAHILADNVYSLLPATGEGNMQGGSTAQKSGASYSTDREQNTHIPDMPISAWASFPAEFITHISGKSTANLACIDAIERGMEPDIYHGDLILFDRGAKEILQDGIYIISLKGNLLVRHAHRNSTNTITLTASNPDYKAISINTTETNMLFYVIGRVTSVIRSPS